ncbi:MAG: ABC transporter permease [Opitutaceae bacterium]|nr:ABC transporter permease [Cytophagales bacterium]
MQQRNVNFYYFRKRLVRNKPAVFGFVIIVLSAIITILGYHIMPDDSPNANEGAVQIQKQTPGFYVKVITLNKNLEVEKVNFFEKLISGQEKDFTFVPVDTFWFQKAELHYVQYGKLKRKENLPLIHAVRNVYVGDSKKLPESHGANFIVKGDSLLYLDLKENQKYASLNDLKEEFINKHVKSKFYLLGTDKTGRDLLSRLLFGTRISLSIGFISVLISLLVGVSLGAMAGYFGGGTDKFIQWLMTVVWSIPSIMLVIAISLALQSKGIWVSFVAVGLTTWVEVARVVRGQVLSLKEKTYIEAARALGLSDLNIISKHIMPNLTGPIIVIATSNFANAILIEAGLSFLGLGVQPPMPSWGMMINEGFHSIGTKNSSHLILLPSLCICLMVLAFNLLGNGLRDAYDPQGKVKL